MGRSVSRPTNASAACYGYLATHNHECLSCGEGFDDFKLVPVSEDDGYSESELKTCPHCGAAEDDCTVPDPQWQFECLVDDVRSSMADAFPSLSHCDTWLGREDHALLENRYCHIGLSEYCSVVSLWITPKDGDWRDGDGWAAMRDHWPAQVDAKFRKTANAILPGAMVRVGGFSNGESVYQRLKEAA